MTSTAIFLQVRLDSTRLPGKALLPLGGKPVIVQAMEALGKVDVDFRVLLTDYPSSKTLRPYAEQGGFDLFAGPDEDVLERYSLAVEHYGVETFIRATGDNPLVSGECARSLLELHRRKGADYSGYRGLPLGTGVECVQARALLEARRFAREAYDREHVCPYLYGHPEMFRIFRPEVPDAYYAPDLRVTLDTEEDYQRIKALYALLYHGEPIRTSDLIHALDCSMAASQ